MHELVYVDALGRRVVIRVPWVQGSDIIPPPRISFQTVDGDELIFRYHQAN